MISQAGCAGPGANKSDFPSGGEAFLGRPCHGHHSSASLQVSRLIYSVHPASRLVNNEPSHEKECSGRRVEISAPAPSSLVEYCLASGEFVRGVDFLDVLFNIYNFCAFFVFLLLCLINYRWTSCVPRDLKYLGVGWMNMAGFYLIFLHPIR